MKKYIGAVLRKSSQLELAAEIGSFEDLMDLQKNVHKNRSKLCIKKIQNYIDAINFYFYLWHQLSTATELEYL